VCLQDVPERRVFQIAMDKNFREIDEEMDKYLTNLANSKDVYF
jgi:Skp family chaperone for outer membrane proteins